MKDLDKTQVYNLRGITEEQARELLEWLKDNDVYWEGCVHYRLMEHTSLEYRDGEWDFVHETSTTHISTLFEKSYEQQLQEAKKQLEHYKKEVERLENESKPKLGDVVKAWQSNENDFVIGILKSVDESVHPHYVGDSGWFKNAKKLTEQEVIDLLFKKS